MAVGQRNSLLGAPSSRPTSKDGDKKNIWVDMLKNAASGKKLPEKNILVLGGTPESQQDFLGSLSSDHDHQTSSDRTKGRAPIANQFALGYTYQDVLDADQEDIIARISVYSLSEPSPSFAPLLRPLLNPKSIPETLIVILLDWSSPWTWIRQLREWVRLLRHVLYSLDDDTKMVMDEVMSEWRDRKRGAEGAAVAGGAAGATIPLGPGEWDEGLGLPLCIVCQKADRIEKLEKENGWKDEEFDFILQMLRTILLKHGASLIYTSPFDSNSLQSLVHSSLGITSLLKRQTLKHNVIDRDKILVPANWDSWGKIRILRDGFDMEGVGTAWSIEIQDAPGDKAAVTNGTEEEEETSSSETTPEDGTSAVHIYEQTIQDPKHPSSLTTTTRPSNSTKIEIAIPNNQEFLASQVDLIEKFKAEDEKASAERDSRAQAKIAASSNSTSNTADDRDNTKLSSLNEHIGPVQFNMGGIQVDADDMLKKIKDREASRTSTTPTTSNIHQQQTQSTSNATTSNTSAAPIRRDATSPAAIDAKAQNEAYATFFADLLNRNGSGGSGGSKPGTPSG